MPSAIECNDKTGSTASGPKTLPRGLPRCAKIIVGAADQRLDRRRPGSQRLPQVDGQITMSDAQDAGAARNGGRVPNVSGKVETGWCGNGNRVWWRTGFVAGVKDYQRAVATAYIDDAAEHAVHSAIDWSRR